MTRTEHEPPRIARFMVEWTLGRGSGDAIVGDLLEAFERDCATRGVRAARWRYRREAFAVVRHIGLTTLGSRTVNHIGEVRMSSFVADLRHGARVFRRSPVFTALVCLTLALAIGATAAVYGVVAPVLLRPLPYARPDRLVLVAERDAHNERDNVGYATFDDLRSKTRTLASLAAFGGWSATLESPHDPEELVGQRVSWNYFDVLGVKLAYGTGFTADEDRVDRSRVVVLSHGLWQRRFGGDTAVVGRMIRLDDQSYLVAGVAPAGFDNVTFPEAQIWRVLGYSPALPYACRTCRHLNVLARLRDGVPLARAAAELNAITAQLAAAYPTDYSGRGVFVEPLQRVITASVRPALLAIASAALLVLLIAAANIVNLQLVRALRRDGEFAIRIALGAGRTRLARQLFAEALLLATVGGLGGLAVARITLPVLVTRLPNDLPRLGAIRLDYRVLGLVALLALGLAIVIGVAPVATRRTREVFGPALRGAGRVGDSVNHRLRHLLVAAEVALALVLLAGTGMLARSLVRLLAVDVGFDPTHLLALRVQSTGSTYGNDSLVYAYHARVLAAVRRVPGVIGTGAANQLPLSGDLDTYGIQDADRPLANPSLAPYADRYTATPDFMRTMGIRLLEGRAFERADFGDSVGRVVIISKSLATRLWPGADPIGRQLSAGNSKRRTVVGVADDVRHQGLDAAAGLQFYVPEREWGSADDHVALVVRTTGDPARLAPAVRDAVASVDPSQPITGVKTMDAVVTASTARRQLALTLFAVFAVLALVLAAAGIYGVLAAAVAERTRELGLRSALGAAPRDLLALVMRTGLTMAAAGVVVGIAGAVVLTRFIHSLLFGIGELDPVSLAGAAVALLAIACAAAIVPAWRAIRADPMVTLRGDS